MKQPRSKLQAFAKRGDERLMTIEVILYTRPDCGLCDEVKAELGKLADAIPLQLVEIDITTDPTLESALHDRIPVVEIGGTRLEAPIDPEALKTALISAPAKAALAETRQVASEPASGRRRKVILALDRFFLGFSKHWLAVVAMLFLLYAGIPFLAPVGMEVGWTGFANVIYKLYSPVCHQFAFRSFFLFGDQFTYPRARAGVTSEGTFEQYASAEPFFDGVDITTLDTPLILAAKQFVGSPRMGYKVAFCERDVAIYAAMALSGFLLIVLKRMGVKVPFLPFWAYILIAIAPIGLDGFSQLFANPPFNGFGLAFYPIRESTPFLRVLTGSLFGFGNAWLAFPYIDESMGETVETLTKKLRAAGVLKPQPAESAAD